MSGSAIARADNLNTGTTSKNMHITGKEKTLAARRPMVACSLMVLLPAIGQAGSDAVGAEVCTVISPRSSGLSPFPLSTVPQPRALSRKASLPCLDRSCAIRRCDQARNTDREEHTSELQS